MSELLALGVSHKTAPLDLRERLSLTEGRAVSALSELTAAAGIHEAAAISTCNRTELYLIVSDPVEAESTALGILTRQAEIRPTELLGHLYSLRATEAARHLLRVTAGLDSMIVGEAEIQGQVKRAYELSMVEGATGPILNRLFRGALSAGGRAREETGVGEKGVSIPSVAVELARRALGDLSERRVLVVGAGETAELVARALVARGVRTVFVANRHYDRAIGLAQRFGGGAVRFEELPEQLAEADIVLTATNSPHHIVERDGLEQVMAERPERPLLMIDIAVPRDIEPACREIAGVSVHDIDDVQTDRRTQRQRPRVRGDSGRSSIIEAELDRFERWLGLQEVVPTISALREHGDEVVRRVLAENEGRWEDLSEADRERVEKLAGAIASRLLHEPDPADPPLGLLRRVLLLHQRPARAVRPRRRVGARGGRRRRERDRAAAQGQVRLRARALAMIRIATRGSKLALTQAGKWRRCSAGLSWSRPPPTASPATSRASCAGSSGRCWPARPRSGSTPPRTCRVRWRAELEIAAVPPREDPADVWIGAGSSLADAPEGARVGTASLRRRAQLLAARPDLRVEELHGNVDTRLRRLAEGELDAIVLAAAGLRRLGRESEIGFRIPVETMVPAPGQGTLVLQVRAGDEETTAAVSGIFDLDAARELTAERAAVRLLDASCTTPVGVFARVEGDRPRGRSLRRPPRRQRVAARPDRGRRRRAGRGRRPPRRAPAQRRRPRPPRPRRGDGVNTAPALHPGSAVRNPPISWKRNRKTDAVQANGVARFEIHAFGGKGTAE